MDADLEAALRASALQYEEEMKLAERNSVAEELPVLFELRHTCRPGDSIFSFLNDMCPVCYSELAPPGGRSVKEWSSGVQGPAPRSLMVTIAGSRKMTRYAPHYLLHVGISDSKGDVYEFDEFGLHYKRTWPESIVVPLHHDATHEEWDAALDQHHKAEKLRVQRHRYLPLDNNCYDYVIRFLNSVCFEGRDSNNKDDVVSKFLNKPVADLESYLAIRERIGAEGYHVARTAPTPRTVTVMTCDGCRDSIAGTRYHCEVCPDFDLCPSCFRAAAEPGTHRATHRMAILR